MQAPPRFACIGLKGENRLMKLFSMFFRALDVAKQAERNKYKADSVNTDAMIDELCVNERPSNSEAATTGYVDESLARLA